MDSNPCKKSQSVTQHLHSKVLTFTVIGKQTKIMSVIRYVLLKLGIIKNRICLNLSSDKTYGLISNQHLRLTSYITLQTYVA